MELAHYPDKFAKKKLSRLFAKLPASEIRYGEADKLLSAQHREPHLEGSYKGNLREANDDVEVLSLYLDGEFAACLSIFLEKNNMKNDEADHFARIDIVIVEDNFRKMGLGKLLVMTSIKYVLDRWGPKLYSLSCLAGHEAMAIILEDVGFKGEQRRNEEYKRETLSFNDVDQDEFSSFIDTRVADTIKLVRYRLRKAADSDTGS